MLCVLGRSVQPSPNGPLFLVCGQCSSVGLISACKIIVLCVRRVWSPTSWLTDTRTHTSWTAELKVGQWFWSSLDVCKIEHFQPLQYTISSEHPFGNILQFLECSSWPWDFALLFVSWPHLRNKLAQHSSIISFAMATWLSVCLSVLMYRAQTSRSSCDLH